tara:strand:+ start:5745 stop:6653 length:909 start_codon:yes stop_codon:yes gene_type:complete
MDPFEKLMNMKTDSTIEMMGECIKRKIGVYCCDAGDLFLKKGITHSLAAKVSMKNKKPSSSKPTDLSLDDFNLVLMRKEPPYDVNFHHVTMLLERTKTKVINSPFGLRNSNEKLMAFNFPSIIPETIVTKNEEHIKSFIKKHRKAVIKPVNMYDGIDVFLLTQKDPELYRKINTVINQGQDYGIVQEFIDSVYESDRRILVLDGKPLGVIKRIPKKGDFRANMAIGGTPTKTKITKNDLNIIKTAHPYLKKQGLDFVGFDIVEGKLLEINVTCPTGLVQLKVLYGKNVTKDVIDFYIKKSKS